MIRAILCVLLCAIASLPAATTADWTPGRGVHPEVAAHPDAVYVAWMGHSMGETLLYQVNFVHNGYSTAAAQLSTILGKLYTGIGSTGKVTSLVSSSVNGEANFGATLNWPLILEATNDLLGVVSSLNYPDRQRDIDKINAYITDFSVRSSNNETKHSFSKPEIAVSGFIEYARQVAARADQLFPPVGFSLDYSVYVEDGYSYVPNPNNITRQGTHQGTLIGTDKMVLRRSLADKGSGVTIDGKPINGVLWVSEGRLGLGGQTIAPGSRIRLVIDPKCVAWPGDPALMAWRSMVLEVDRNRNLAWSWNNMRGIYVDKNEETKTWSGAARHQENYQYRFDTRTVTWYNEIKSWWEGMAIKIIDANNNTVVDIDEYNVWRGLIADGTIGATDMAIKIGGSFYSTYRQPNGLVPLAALPPEYQAAITVIPVPDEPEAWVDPNTLIQAYWMGNYTPPATP